MSGQLQNRNWNRGPLVGQRLVWTTVGVVLAIIGLHYGAAEWNEWVRRGLGW